MRHRRVRRERGRGKSWQVIYMDLMTNIMIFFVILWSLNQAKDEGVSDTVGDISSRVINLPGDVLFATGQTELLQGGKDVIERLFSPANDVGLDFNTSGLVKRMLMVHGHTDSVGAKDSNLLLGFERALSAYKEIGLHNDDLPDHVIICTHADNSPAEDVPVFQGSLTQAQREIIREANQQNRRITIEDRIINRFEAE